MFLITNDVWLNFAEKIAQSLRTSRMWHKVNFQRSLTVLNSEFSFSLTDYSTKVKEPVCPTIHP